MKKINKRDLILALLMAVVLWAYVLGELDPIKTTILRNIPIEFTNEDALLHDGMIVTEKEYTTVSITYSGKRSNLVNLKMEDFKVIADLSAATVGKNEIAIDASAPSYVEIENVSIKHLNVTVDEYVSESKPVDVEIINHVSDDSEPYIMQLSKDAVEVTGAKTLVSKVVKLQAQIDASRVGNELKALSVELVPVDSSGNVVEGVELANNSISVSVIMHNKKTVELVIPIEGLNSGAVTRTVSAPKTITIKGPDEILKGISEITAETIDVSKIYEDSEVTVTPIIPKGAVQTEDSKDLVATVKVLNAASKDFEYKSNDVEVVGISDDCIATLDGASIKVSIKGLSQTVNQADSRDITLQINAQGLSEGTYDLPIIIKTDLEGLDEISVEPTNIIVSIEKATESKEENTEHQSSETNTHENAEEEE